MPAGIECYNADGSLQFSSINTRLIAILASVQTGTSNGSIAVPGLSGRQGLVLKCNNNIGYTPDVTLNGTLVTWTFDSSWPIAKRKDTLLTVLGF